MRTIKGITALTLVAAFAAACTGGAASPSPAATEAPTTAPTEAPSAAATEAPTAVATPDACAPENLALKTAGVMTIGTDNPAYPPYFETGDGDFTAPWEDLGYTGDPGSGKGFESAVAYAVADKLGFAKDKVTWVVVPFTNAFAPGAKTFDFLINQVSYTPERAEAVDLSEGYYNLNQARRRAEGQPGREGHDAGGSQGLQVRRHGRHHELRRHPEGHRPDDRDAPCTTRTTRPSRPSRPSRSTRSSSTCRRPTST